MSSRTEFPAMAGSATFAHAAGGGARRPQPRTRAGVRCLLLCATLVGAGAACSSGSGSAAGSGGASGPSSGGTSGSGGAGASGGNTGSGGVPGSGGATSRGGQTGSGGTNASGGVTGQGGISGFGGTTGSGGASVSGGTTGSGGAVASGGSSAVGGAPGTGGAAGRDGGSTAVGTGGNAGRDGGSDAPTSTGGATGTGGVSTGTGGARPDGGGADGTSDGGGDTGTAYMPCPTTAGTACAVLPLGDSITEGCCTAPMGGYRIELFRQSVSNSKNLTFVGSLTNGPATVQNRTFPQHHEGHGGYTIDTLGGKNGISGQLTDSALSNYHPNIVLLKIGTNDINSNIDVVNAPTRLGKLIDEITTNAPSALLVVSSIIPTADNSTNQRVQTYNAAIPGLVNARAAAGKHVVFLDSYAAFAKNASYATALMADGLHPNDAGYVILGQAFYGAIGALLPAGP